MEQQQELNQLAIEEIVRGHLTAYDTEVENERRRAAAEMQRKIREAAEAKAREAAAARRAEEERLRAAAEAAAAKAREEQTAAAAARAAAANEALANAEVMAAAAAASAENVVVPLAYAGPVAKAATVEGVKKRRVADTDRIAAEVASKQGATTIPGVKVWCEWKFKVENVNALPDEFVKIESAFGGR